MPPDTLPQHAELISYAPALRRYFRRHAPGADVDDLVQDVFLSMQSRQAQEAIINLQGYLFTVAAHVLSRYRVRPRMNELTNDVLPSQEVIGPERALQSREDLQLVIAVLNELPEKTRHIFVLQRFEEFSYADIARHFGISVSAVEKHMIAALRALAKRMKGSA